MSDRAFAFFDVDDTVISIKSMFGFQDYWYEYFDSEGKADFEDAIRSLRNGDAPREEINRRYYSFFSGREVSRVDECSSEWFTHVLKTVPGLFHTNVLKHMREHERAGDEVVFVSGSFPAVLRPIAHHLGVRHVLSTRMEVENGNYTGQITPPPVIGAGKSEAITRFLGAAKTRPEICYAYGDDFSDLPMLSSVGHPRVVAGNPELMTHAVAAGWPVISPF